MNTREDRPVDVMLWILVAIRDLPAKDFELLALDLGKSFILRHPDSRNLYRLSIEQLGRGFGIVQRD